MAEQRVPTRGGRDVLLLALLVGLPVGAAFRGASGPLALPLGLGPGDSPYVRGFAPDYEIDDKLATHWTRYHAGVELPLTAEGGPLSLTLRYARVFPETAEVEVSFAGRLVDAFRCRGGRFEERRIELGASAGTPVAFELRVDSHEGRDRGLKLDWIRFDAGPGTRLRLDGVAKLRAGALVALVFLLLRAAGWSASRAGLLTAPLASLGALGLLWDPWLTHRMLTGVPELTLLAGGAGIGVGLWLRARGRLRPQSLRTLAALGLAALVGRAIAVSHPEFYYPDQRTHARLVEKVAEQGLGFFVDPSTAIWEHGVWRVAAYGRTYAFPYSPAFHLPFVPLALDYDARLTAMKLSAVAVSAVPLLLVWALARQLGASPLGAGLMLIIPTYTSRLSFAFFPSLLGHALDTAFVLWLVARCDRLREPAVLLRGALWVSACQLAYVSGVVNIGLLVSALALAVAWQRRAERDAGRAALGILGMGLAGSLASVALYYRDFLGVAADMLPHALGFGGGRAASHFPIQSFFAVAYDRTRDFFGFVYPYLAALGLALLLRAGRARSVLLAWLGAYGLLLLGRAKVPDVFLHGHETTFVTPLVCLAAGETLSRLWKAGPASRAAAVGLLAYLAATGLAGQWRAVAAQLGNAL
ncbi:MAG: hypothetical protein AB7O37_07735 [Vicinamibacteria bacterium]